MSKSTFRILILLWVSLVSVQAQENVSELTDKKIVVDGQTFYLYQVQPAEGLYRVSKKFGVTTQEILKFNPGAENGLQLGQVLRIPMIEGRNSNETELDRNNDIIYHKVEKGQTLYYISRKYDVSQEDIITLNPGAEKSLRLGMNLRIPVKKELPKTDSKDNSFLYHEVQPKETLYFLSRKYKVPVKDIISENPGLESGVIQIGTTLRIPCPEGCVGDSTIRRVAQEVSTYQGTDNYLEDEKYVYHELKQGETIFSLAMRYNVKAPEILKANNIEDVSDIAIGYMVRIPKHKIVTMSEKDTLNVNGIVITEDYIVHIADKKETLQEIAKRYGVNADSIVALNPDIPEKRWEKLKKNEKVKIPRHREHVAELVEERISLKDSVDLQFLQDSLFLSKAFVDGCDTAGFGGTINVAFMGPFYLERNDSINLVKTQDENGWEYYTERGVKKIFPEINIFREFYFGSLLAIDEMKKRGVSVNVYTYDVKSTPDDEFSLQEVLSKPELKNMDFIFGPAHSDQVGEVAEFCKNYDIRLVLPFGNKHESVVDNKYVFSLFANEQLLYPRLVEKMVDTYKDANFIVVRGNDPGERDTVLAKMLKQNIFARKWDNATDQQYYEVNFDKDGIYGVEQVLTKDKPSIILITSTDKKLFNKLLPNLFYLKSRKDYPISLVGYPEYLRAIGNDLEYIFSLNTMVYSQYYVDYTNDEVQRVLAKYRSWFGGEPTVRHPSQGILHPNNGLLGYDATLYFLSAYKAYGSQFERCLQHHGIKTTESDFKFKRENTWGGFSNQNINFIQYTEDFDMELK